MASVYQKSEWRLNALIADLRRTLRMGLPLVGAQLLQTGNALVDTLIAARIGKADLAAAGIGSALWFLCSLLCIGLMAGLSPTLSRLMGEGQRRQVGVVFRQGLWLAVTVGVIALILLVGVRWLITLLPLEPELIPRTRDYLYGVLWSLPFVALVMAARNVCEATGQTRPVLLVCALGLGINALSSYALGLGHFGLPAYGLMGIGLATTIVNVCMALALLMLLKGPRFQRLALFEQIEPPIRAILAPMLGLSIPIFLALLFEAGLFVATAVQMGTIGVLESSAHQIAISALTFCYMVPMGLSFAMTARVGRADGRQMPDAVRLRIASGCVLIVLTAGLTASILVMFRYPIAMFYTSDPALVEFAAGLLLLGALFQLSDGTQIMLTGMLRGLHDTKVPMLINAFSYWVIAFGVGVYAAHGLEWGAQGLWVGLILGLTVASVLLALRLRWIIRQKTHAQAAV